MKIQTPGNIAVIDPKDVGASAPVSTADDQKALRALISRRHPEYSNQSSHWSFLSETYNGGREWFKLNVFKYIKEGSGEYSDRIARCYRFNHSREVVDLLNKYLFKQVIVRNDADAPESVQKFWKKATKSGLNIRDFSRQVSKKSSIFGRIAIVADSNALSAGLTSKADEKAQGIQAYAYIVEPIDLLDYSFDADENLNWVLIREHARDDENPLSSSGAVSSRYRLWTKTNWTLLEDKKARNGKSTIVILDSGDHSLGEVPVVLHDNIISDELYVSPALIDDIAYLDRAVANYLSNLDAIIQDQTFSQLAMPAQNVLPGSDNFTTLTEMGTKRVFLYDGEGGAAPHYLSPDPKQAQMILAVINKIINEIYHTVGLAGERTKQDNALGIDNSSGVAKAYDFERVNALLAAKADSLEVTENKVARLIAKWHGEEAQVTKDFVTYPDNFDTRGLYDEFDISARLNLVEAPASVRQLQMENLIDKLFPQLAKALREKMMADLKNWPIDPVELAGQMAAATASSSEQAVAKTSDRNMAKATMEAK